MTWLFEVLVTVAAVAASVAGWRALQEHRHRDPYDLEALREFHEREEISELDPGFVSDDADTVVCLHCGTARRRRIPVCPNCKCGG